MKIQPTIVNVNVILSSNLLNLIGQNTNYQDSFVYTSTYNLSVNRGCDAIEAMALFIATTLAFPMRFKIKFAGLLIGVAAIFFLNLIRIITLFLAGTYAPSIFEMLYVQLWPVVFIIVAVLLWISVVRRNKIKLSNA